MILKIVSGLKELILLDIDMQLFLKVFITNINNLKDTTLYFHGGFEPDKPNLPLDTLIGIDLGII